MCQSKVCTIIVAELFVNTQMQEATQMLTASRIPTYIAVLTYLGVFLHYENKDTTHKWKKPTEVCTSIIPFMQLSKQAQPV